MKVKTPQLVAVPPGVVTLMVPVAPRPSVALMLVALFTVKEVAAVPPMLTAVAPERLLPLMETTVPAPPPVGVNAVMDGGAMKVNVPQLDAVPPEVVTVILPVAPLPTIALMEVVLITVKEAAAVLPMVTAVTPVKLVPLMDTAVPTPPLVGVNEVMVGGPIYVKVQQLVAVPLDVVTVILPVAPLPTVAFMVVVLFTVKEAAAVPPMVTAVTPVKFVPVMVTTVPALPLLGVNEVRVSSQANAGRQSTPSTMHHVPRLNASKKSDISHLRNNELPQTSFACPSKRNSG